MRQFMVVPWTVPQGTGSLWSCQRPKNKMGRGQFYVMPQDMSITPAVSCRTGDMSVCSGSLASYQGLTNGWQFIVVPRTEQRFEEQFCVILRTMGNISSLMSYSGPLKGGRQFSVVSRTTMARAVLSHTQDGDRWLSGFASYSGRKQMVE